MQINFENKNVLITGATRGIGKSIAEEFEKAGANLLLTGTNINEIESLNGKLKEEDRKKYYALDLKNKSSIIDFIQSMKKIKKIDVLVNNAGINKINYIYDTIESDLDDILNVNIKAPFLLIKEISSLMKEQNYGRIINIASIFGTITREKRAAYTTSKAALIGLTKTASVDLAKYNILVNTVSPGFILTDLTKSILSESEIKELESKVPIGRFGKPDEIAKLVLFLSSELNTYLTGQNIIIDGGYVNI
jgi:3-oxoacyl-[acyl-carrier protein] reductase